MVFLSIRPAVDISLNLCSFAPQKILLEYPRFIYDWIKMQRKCVSKAEKVGIIILYIDQESDKEVNQSSILVIR